MANIRSWKNALRKAINDPWDSDIDSDHPSCPKCSNTMNFYGHDDSGDFPYGEGYWHCGNCGYRITEDDL